MSSTLRSSSYMSIARFISIHLSHATSMYVKIKGYFNLDQKQWKLSLAGKMDHFWKNGSRFSQIGNLTSLDFEDKSLKTLEKIKENPS